jgi:tRNA dimethylallyltransferase
MSRSVATESPGATERRGCPEPVFLAGPTAVGKSAVALELAERWNGEIITVDSMQVYRGLDIGTAKPTAEDRRRVAHHLVDVVDLRRGFDAAEFVRRAEAAAEEIRSRNRTAIFCGGTGLYFKAFLEGLGGAPAADPKLRAELEQTPAPALLDELAARDPAAYARIDRQNRRRIVRALEILRLTGKPLEDQRAAWGAAGPGWREGMTVRCFGFSRDPADLRERIEARVDAMFAAGLVEEVERLLPLGLAENRTALQAIGYRQVVEHLRGEWSLPETLARVKQATRQLAKRQMTWFRTQMNPEWIPLGRRVTPGEVADELERRRRQPAL